MSRKRLPFLGIIALACGGPAAVAPDPTAPVVSTAACEDREGEPAEVANEAPGDLDTRRDALVVTRDDTSLPTSPKKDGPPMPTAEQALSAMLHVFPEAYRELAKVRFESGDGKDFVLDDVMVLVPAAKLKGIHKSELKTRACEVKTRLGLDCACEKVQLAPAENYAWHSWPDKRVVPVTLQFFIAC